MDTGNSTGPGRTGGHSSERCAGGGCLLTPTGAPAPPPRAVSSAGRDTMGGSFYSSVCSVKMMMTDRTVQCLSPGQPAHVWCWLCLGAALGSASRPLRH